MKRKLVHITRKLLLIMSHCILIILVLQSEKTFAAHHDIYPGTISSISNGGSSYCQYGNVVPLSVSITNTTCTGTNGNGDAYVNITYTWYSNSVPGITGGTVVASHTTTSATTIDTYSPSSATVGTLYYYCTVTWSTGTYCITENPTGITTASSVSVTITTSSPPTATSDGPKCGPATFNLSASGGSYSNYFWYDANNEGNLLTYCTSSPCVYNTPSLSSTNNYYVSDGSLGTEANLATAVGGSACSNGGAELVWDITNNNSYNSIIITKISSRCTNAGTYSIKIYYYQGTYVGHDANPAGWRQVFNSNVTVTAGLNTFDITDFYIPPSGVSGILIWTSDKWNFTTSSATTTGTDITITAGSYTCAQATGPFSGTALTVGANPYGAVYYKTISCESSRTACQALIGVPPAITTQPTNKTMCYNSSADFSLATTNCGTSSYQWKYNGLNVVNGTPAGAIYTNANTSVLNISGTIAAGTYSPYTCVISNSYGSITSNSAQLTVSATAAPSAPTALTATPQYFCTGGSSTIAATVEPGSVLQWHSSSCDGTTVSSPVSPAVTTTYYAKAYNSTSGCYSACSNITVGVMDAPVIVTNPIGTFGCNGTPLTFSIVATGAGLSYQWQENGINISNIGVYSGCTTENLTISNPSGLGGKQYRCVITSTCGSVTTSAATLSVLASGLSGTRTVGAGGDYTTLKLAFDAINANGLTGDLDLKIISDITDNTEAILNQWNSCGNTGYTVTIYPGTSARTLTGSVATSLVTLNGADHVTFDGRIDKTGAANSLILSNTNTSGSTLKLVADACNNTVKYCTLKGVSDVATTGVVWISTATATGNDSNTITYCDIKDGASNPLFGIYALGTSGLENDNNTISYCNIYNFWKSASYARGIYILGGNTKWSIKGNSIYQTSARADAAFYGIEINNTQGGEFLIDGNYIGGTQPACGGSKMTYSSASYNISFEGIITRTSSTGISTFKNNVIKNISFTSSPISSTVPSQVPIFAGIDIYSGRTDVIGNSIGDNSTNNSIEVTVNDYSTNTAWNNGIYKNGEGNVINNTIGSIYFSGTIGDQCGFNPIEVTGTMITDQIISGNVIGSTTVANSIQTASGATPAVTIGGIYFGTGGNFHTTVSNNIIANITIGCNSTTPFMIGLNNQATAGSQTVIGNSIFNITTASSRTGSFSTATDFPAIVGIRTNNTSANNNLNISANNIYSLISTHATALVNVYGIHCGTGTSGNHMINGNKIHSFSTTSTSSSVTQNGIVLASGIGTISNNMIRLNGNGIATDNLIIGINNATTSTNSVYFNSVYIGGTATGIQNSTAYNRSGTGITNIRNNIFVNARTGGTGTHYAYFLGSIANLTSNYNIYFNEASGVVAYAGADRTDIAGIRTGTGGDLNSDVVNPSFINPTGNASTVDLHINAGSPAIGVAVTGTGIATDFDNEQRETGSPNPCIGADEKIAPPPGMNAYGIYSPEALGGTVVDCEIFATGGASGGIGYQVASPTDAHYANVGISTYQEITAQNVSCLHTNVDFTTSDGTPDWLMGNGSAPASGSSSPLFDIQYSSLGRKDIIESVKVFKDFINMTMDKPEAGTILGAPSGAGCPTTYNYTSSVAGNPGYTYAWSCVVPGGCATSIATPSASTTDITFINLTGVNQVFVLQLDISTECCGPLDRIVRYITIYPAPAAPTALSPYSLCTGGSQTILVTAPNPAYSYNWFSTSTGGTSIGPGSSYNVNPVLSGSTSYFVEAINSYGCPSARTPVVVTGLDTPAPTVANQQTCGVGDVTFVVSSPIAGAAYNWYTGTCGGTIVQSGASTSFTTTVSATTTFYVQAIPSGCGPSTCAAPVATFVTPPNPIVWLGTVGGVNNWFNTANWTSGCLPTCATNVSIPGTSNNPDIGFNATANAACHDINLQAAAGLSFSDAKAELDVCGNMTHSGLVTSNNLGLVKFMGTAAQTYSKTGSGDFHNVTLYNTNATPSLTLSSVSGGDLILDNTGTFEFISGKVITGANQLTLKNPLVSSLTGHSIDNYVVGNLTRYVNTSGSYDLPLGNINAYELANINISSTSGLTYLATNFSNPANAEGTGLPSDDNGYSFDLLLNCGGTAPTTGHANGGVWTITPNAGSATYALTLYGRNYDNAGTTHTIVKRVTSGPGAWAFLGTFSTNSIAGNIVTSARTTYSGFSQFAIARSSTILPIELISFYAKCTGNNAKLDWATASEANNEFFTLERSSNANDWDFVANIDGAGNSTQLLHYTYTDENAYSGTTYYQLIQNDYDGRKEYFGPVSINCEESMPPSIVYYPNPFTSNVTINISNLSTDKATVTVYNQLGQQVRSTELHQIDPGNQTFELDLKSLANGVYTIQFRSPDFDNVTKLVKYH